MQQLHLINLKRIKKNSNPLDSYSAEAIVLKMDFKGFYYLAATKMLEHEEQEFYFGNRVANGLYSLSLIHI